MKNLNYEEFQERISEVAKSRKIFIPHITKNISIAFELYQEALAEEQMDVMISKINTPFGNIERPRCDECDTELKLDTMPRHIEGNFYPTTWICEECGTEYYTEKTANEWYEELKIES